MKAFWVPTVLVIAFMFGMVMKQDKDRMPVEYNDAFHCLDKAVWLAEHADYPVIIEIGWSNIGLHAEALWEDHTPIDGNNGIEASIIIVGLEDAKDIQQNHDGRLRGWLEDRRKYGF